MSTTKTIQSALISVFSKEGLEPIVRLLNSQNVTLYSTGGTEDFIKNLGIPLFQLKMSLHTHLFLRKSKTLHPKVFGGILNRQDNPSDVQQMEEFNIPQIDLVIVDLYPFEKTVASGASEADIIEKIDIGGISLIRAAAKNFKDTVIVASVDEYSSLLNLITAQTEQLLLRTENYLLQKHFMFLLTMTPQF
jgi:phosphoribosylaminoimidazolecarboxamide formyltransferase/IMP cyclohydrolase